MIPLLLRDECQGRSSPPYLQGDSLSKMDPTLELMMANQVDHEHYRFSAYVDRRRWASYWYQVNEVLKLKPSSVLEVGPGPGLFKAVGSTLGLHITTVDKDSNLRPDFVACATSMPFSDQAFDVVCAFQVLEHFPFEKSVEALQEMSRVADRAIVLSLPDAYKRWKLTVDVSCKFCRSIYLPRPWRRMHRHQFDGQHYWEINKAGYGLREVARHFESATRMTITSTYRVPENDYHRIFLLAR